MFEYPSDWDVILMVQISNVACCVLMRCTLMKWPVIKKQPWPRQATGHFVNALVSISCQGLHKAGPTPQEILLIQILDPHNLIYLLIDCNYATVHCNTVFCCVTNKLLALDHARFLSHHARTRISLVPSIGFFLCRLDYCRKLALCPTKVILAHCSL